MVLLRAQRHMPHAPLPLATHGPLRAAARMQRLLHGAGSRTPLPSPAAVASARACSAAFLVQGSHPLFGRPFLFFSSPPLFFLRARARTHAHARTHAQERPTTNDATYSPPAWLTGSRHDRGIRSVRSPLRRAPLLATPIATPLQGGRPERPGPFVS